MAHSRRFFGERNDHLRRSAARPHNYTPQNVAQVQDTHHPDHDLAATLTQLLAEASHSDPMGMIGTAALHQTPLDHGQHDFHLG